jgi:hypothetical protein
MCLAICAFLLVRAMEDNGHLNGDKTFLISW